GYRTADHASVQEIAYRRFPNLVEGVGRLLSRGSPPHQLLGGLLVLLEELAVVLALDDLRIERERLGLGLVLLRADGLLEVADQRGLDLLRQAGRRGDPA